MGKSIEILCGISGSGKSTYAFEKWKNNPSNTVIVCRDKIRELLFGYTESNISEYYLKKNINDTEKTISKYEDTLIAEALSGDNLVIVDATHLKASYISRFNYWNVPITLTKFDIPLEEAIFRDSKRTRIVGQDVITSQFLRYSNIPEISKFIPIVRKDTSNLPPCFIFDIDGTLALNNGHRSPYDWSKIGEDTVNEHVKISCNAIYKSYPVIICTGRDEVCLQETKNWLNKNSIGYSDIYARANGDNRADYIVKEEMWDKIEKTYNIMGMFDDRLQVVRRARNLGYKVLNVEYNNF